MIDLKDVHQHHSIMKGIEKIIQDFFYNLIVASKISLILSSANLEYRIKVLTLPGLDSNCHKQILRYDHKINIMM